MNNEETFQKITIELDGVETEATILNIIEMDGKEYAIYSTSRDAETSNILFSEIKKDEEGYDTFVDVDDPEIKSEITKIAMNMFVGE